jgi:hypothetical protein
VNVLNWAKFLAALLPYLSDLARELFKRHGGDVEAAKAELKTITDYGLMRREKQLAIDREIADWRAEQGRKGKIP